MYDKRPLRLLANHVIIVLACNSDGTDITFFDKHPRDKFNYFLSGKKT